MPKLWVKNNNTKISLKRLILCETPNRGKQLYSVFYMALEDCTFKKQTASQRLAWNISEKQPLLRVTMRVSDIKSRQFCFLLKIQKNYDCFFVLYSLLNRFQRRGPLEDIVQRNVTCFTWTDKFKLITWNFLISYFMR